MNLFTKNMSNAKDVGLLILRVVFGLTLLYGHGFGKLSTIFGGQEIQFMDPIGIGPTLSFYLAAFAEGICAILLIIGFYSRWATLILAINFIVILIFHIFMSGDVFDVLELRYLYFFTFLALMFTGPGRYSIDYMQNRED